MSMLLPDQINLAEVAFQQFLADEEVERQLRIIKARDAWEGDIDEALVTELQESLVGELDENFLGYNAQRVIVGSLRDRLNVIGFETTNPELTAWIMRWWEISRMTGHQSEVHKLMLRDGEGFVIVDYAELGITTDPEGNEKTGYPRFWPNQRYTDPENGGDGEGVRIWYPHDNVFERPLFAVKRWTETTYPDNDPENPVTRMRMTIYRNSDDMDVVKAKVERYFAEGDGGGEIVWEQYTEDELPFPIWWTDNGSESGVSLPFPVIHFKNEDLSQRGKVGYGMQTAVDQALVSLMMATGFTGAPLLTLSGGYATTDGKEPSDDGENRLRIRPNRIVGAPHSEAKWGMIQPGDLSRITSVIDKHSQWGAMYTNTPQLAALWLASAGVSGETIKSISQGQTSEVLRLQVTTGDSWEEMVRVAVSLEVKYAGGDFDPRATITTQWTPADPRDANSATADLTLKKELGIPDDQLWLELGYSDEQIAVFRQMWEQGQARLAQLSTDDGGTGETAVSDSTGEADDTSAVG